MLSVPQMCGIQVVPLPPKSQMAPPFSAMPALTLSIGILPMSSGCSSSRSAHCGAWFIVGEAMSKPRPLVALSLLMISSFEPMPVKLILMPVFWVKLSTKLAGR